MEPDDLLCSRNAGEEKGNLVVLLLAERAPSEGPRSTRAFEDRPSHPLKRETSELGSTILCAQTEKWLADASINGEYPSFGSLTLLGPVFRANGIHVSRSQHLTSLPALLDFSHTMYHVLIAALLLLTVTEPAHAGQRQDIFRHAKAATVLIVGVDDAAHSLSLGSGFFVDASGLLVTNAHVIEESARLYVYVLDREIYAAPEVVAVDPDLDLAVLRIPNTWADPLALAADATPEGAEVIAVGYPRITDILQMGFALHASIIPAMVSGLVPGQSRTNGRVVDFLQTAGLLNFGNSGGPLVRTDTGEVAAMVVTTVPYLERAKDAHGVAIGSVMMKVGHQLLDPCSDDPAMAGRECTCRHRRFRRPEPNSLSLTWRSPRPTVPSLPAICCRPSRWCFMGMPIS